MHRAAFHGRVLSDDPALRTLKGSVSHASSSEEAALCALSGLQRRDEPGAKGHYNVMSLASAAASAAGKHVFLGLQTEIDSPPPYLGDSRQ